MRATWRRGTIQKFVVAVELFVSARMLKHVPKQAVSGDRDRQWMSDDYFDLIVWYKTDGEIHGFQLCYGKPAWERALTWLDGRGFSHTEIDTGEEKATRNRTPILVPDGSFPAAKVAHEFARRSVNLPRNLRDLVESKIAEFVAKRNA